MTDPYEPTEPPEPPTDPTAIVQAKIDRLLERAAGKQEAVITVRQEVGGTTLSDDDMNVIEITLRLPASALLGNVALAHRASTESADVMIWDSDPTDPVTGDSDIGPMADADGVDLVHSVIRA